MHVSTRKMSWAAVFLAFALCACNTVTGPISEPTQDDGTSQPANFPQALVIGKADSVVLNALRDKVELVPYDGSQNGADYGMVIFDGDAHSADAIHEHQVLQSALQAHQWVLGVDVTAEHKRDGLGNYTHVATNTPSPGYLVRLTGANGHAATQVIDYVSDARLFGDVASDLASQALEPIRGTPEGATKFVDSLIELLDTEGIETQQLGDVPPTIPANVIYYPVYYRQIIPWQTGGGQKANKSGHQNVYYQMDYTFDLFLDVNLNGNFQWVSVRIDGQANPTNGTGNFANMVKDEKAWWQDRLKFSINPSDDNKDLFASYGNSPENANGVTTVTSGVEFNIGVGKDGPSGDFKYSYQQTRQITDWKVTNSSSGDFMEWDYRSSRLDADKVYGCSSSDDGYVTNGFDSSSCYPLEPSDLSKNTLSVHAQGVWKTDKVLNKWVDFDAYSEHHVADTYCSTDFGLVCHSRFYALSKRGWVGIPNTFSINMAAVIPIALKSITFDQNPAPAGKTVIGTLTLESPAQANVIVPLKSESQNATVKSSVSITKGETSATFQVLTNANGIAKDGSTTATITASYGDGLQAQLVIVNQAFIDLSFEDLRVYLNQDPTRTGKISLSSPAPAGGATVGLGLYDVSGNLDNGSAFFPESVTIPQGKTSVPVTIKFTNGGPPDNAFGFFLRADGGAWGQDEVKFVVSRE